MTSLNVDSSTLVEESESLDFALISGSTLPCDQQVLDGQWIITSHLVWGTCETVVKTSELSSNSALIPDESPFAFVPRVFHFSSSISRD